MRYKLLTVLFLGLVLAGCSKAPGMGNVPSFRTQMSELVQLCDAGLISEQEYHMSKKMIFSTMVH